MARQKRLKPHYSPYTTLFRSKPGVLVVDAREAGSDQHVVVHQQRELARRCCHGCAENRVGHVVSLAELTTPAGELRSEEHTSELQSQFHIVCRLLLEKKKMST